MKIKKMCANCRFSVVLRKKNETAPNVVCIRRSNFQRGRILLIQEDGNCRNWEGVKKNETD